MNESLIIRSIVPFTLSKCIEDVRLADKMANWLVIGMVPFHFPLGSRERRAIVRFPTDGAADRCGAALMDGSSQQILECLALSDAAVAEVELPDHPGVIVHGNPALLPPFIQSALAAGHSLNIVPPDLSPESVGQLFGVPAPDAESLLQALSKAGSELPEALKLPEPKLSETKKAARRPDTRRASKPLPEKTSAATTIHRETPHANPRQTWRDGPITPRQIWRVLEIAKRKNLVLPDLASRNCGQWSDFISEHKKADEAAGVQPKSARLGRRY